MINKTDDEILAEKEKSDDEVTMMQLKVIANSITEMFQLE